jgi:hypothetical protein
MSFDRKYLVWALSHAAIAAKHLCYFGARSRGFIADAYTVVATHALTGR